MTTSLANEFTTIESIEKIVKGTYIVYALKFNNEYIVLGNGTRNRAKVIFDDIDTITYSHLKSFRVRLYHLFKPKAHSHTYIRQIIKCDNKKMAEQKEKALHKENRKSNTNELVKEFESDLEKKWKDFPQVELLLKIALNSSYSGLNDLRKWYKKGLIDPKDADQIKKMLKLEKLKGWKLVN